MIWWWMRTLLLFWTNLAVVVGQKQTQQGPDYHQKTSSATQPQDKPAASAGLKPRPVFLFSGQSNMEGHTTDSMGIEAGEKPPRNMFKDMLEILGLPDNDGGKSKRGLGSSRHYGNNNTREQMKWALFNRLQEAYKYRNFGVCPACERSSEAEVQEILNLFDGGWLNSVALPHETATCFFICPSNDTNTLFPAVPVSPTSRCGYEYGPELMFAHTLSSYTNPSAQESPPAKNSSHYHFSNLTIAKVAAGGTRIYDHWFPGHGEYWDDLNETIHSTINGDDDSWWQGFAWYQGENDSFLSGDNNDVDTSLTYLGNLTVLVNTVRTELHRASSYRNLNHRWKSPSDIPVAIFEIGPWPDNEAAQRVRDAQATFVASDPNAILLSNSDLSQFYHFDPLAHLIMGDRMATQWASLLQSSFANQNQVLSSTLEESEQEGQGEEFISDQKIQAIEGKGRALAKIY